MHQITVTEASASGRETFFGGSWVVAVAWATEMSDVRWICFEPLILEHNIQISIAPIAIY